jgi:hypothetical protein
MNISSHKTILIGAFGLVALSAILWAVALTTRPPTGARPLTANTAPTPRSQSPTVTLTNAERLNKASRHLSAGTSSDLDLALQLLNEIPSAAPENKQALVLYKKIAEKRAPFLRNRLADDYRNTVASANPHLNYIDKKITKVKGGHALWATHDFFTRYTLSAGNDAHVISAWIDRHSEELREAGIVRVGVMGTGPYASWSHFDIK